LKNRWVVHVVSHHLSEIHDLVQAEAWDGGEAGEGEADKGEADEGEGDGFGGTLNLGNSDEVYICIFVMMLSIYTCIY
jgi:hypothetical protein